jgi:hypothetical protein
MVGGATEANQSGFATSPHLRTHLWRDNGTHLVFPEQERHIRWDTANSAICFSGGGMVSLSATMGQLRGLHALGLIPRIRYLSSVSGGARAAIAFTYYRSGARDDAEFLGPVTPPEQISFAGLRELPSTCLGHLGTKDPTVTMFLLSGEGVAGDQLWLQAAGLNYLAPFGLYDPAEPGRFSFDAATVTSIKANNPALAGATFYTVRDPQTRPYLIAETIFVCPTAASPFRTYRLVNCEVTPLYVGNPFALSVTYDPLSAPPVTARVGGGYIEPFAFGSPRLEHFADGVAAVVAPPRPYSLADVSGTATASFSADAHNFFGVLSPKWHYWPPGAGDRTDGQSFNFGDGGNLEDYGLISVLLRKVRTAAVFINTSVKINPDYDPETPPTLDDIDPNLPTLFGYPNEFSPSNQVFEKAAFAPLVRALQAARRAGRSVIAKSDLKTVANDWWGLDGEHQVSILWVYNERVLDWEQRIPAASGVPAAIEAGNAATPDGPFVSFPNFQVAGQNAPGSIALTPEQINLLADVACWNITANADLFAKVLGS